MIETTTEDNIAEKSNDNEKHGGFSVGKLTKEVLKFLNNNLIPQDI